MTKHKILSLVIVYSLIILSVSPFQIAGQIKNTKSDKTIRPPAEKIPAENEKTKNPLNFVPAQNPVKLIQKKPIPPGHLKKKITQFRNTPNHAKSTPHINFKEIEKIPYKKLPQQKKKKNNEKTILIVMVVAVFEVIVVLAATTNVPECDPTACDPFDEDCICG